MIDLLAPPKAEILTGAVVILFFLGFIQLLFSRLSDFVWVIRLLMVLIAIYLLWHGGAWLVSRFM